MTTYLGEKAVGIGTIKATKAVAGDVLHDETLVGNGNTEPLGVDKQVIATTNQVANLSVTLHAAIEAQADMITEHAEELTTLRGNQASLGDQVSGIEEKIPGDASATNQLATKADLKDVGGDFVKKSGDTMTGILTIQAEEDYDPSTPPVGGLSFKSNASPDGFTNRMRQVANGFIAIEYLLNGKQYSNLVFSDQEIYIDNTENGTGNPVSLGTSGNPWDNVYAKKLNNGADVVIPTEGGTLARKEDLIDLRADINEADSELQSQITAQAGAIAGLESDKLDRNLDPLNAGKYLIVGDDGNVELTTSGGGGELPDNVVLNNSIVDGGIAIGENAYSAQNTAVALGRQSNAGNTYATSIGYSSYAGYTRSTAIGASARTGASWAVQIGYGTNNDSSTLKVGLSASNNYELLSADGTIPLERLTKVTDQIGDISTALTAILGE